MDLTELPVVVPSGGILVVLVYLIIHVMRQSSSDRGDYHDAVIELREQHVEEINELTARHSADMGALREQHLGQIEDLRLQVETLRGEVADLRNQIEAERRARWQAEDSAAKYRRLLDTHGLGLADDESATGN